MSGLNLPSDDEQSDEYPFAVATERFCVIRQSGVDGPVVAKFDVGGSGGRFPKTLYSIDSLVVTYPDSKTDFENLSLENVELTDEQLSLLQQCGAI